MDNIRRLPLDEIKKIMVAVSATGLMTLGTTYVQFKVFTGEFDRLKKDVEYISTRLDVVNQHSTDLNVRAVWMAGINEYVTETKALNKAMVVFEQETRRRTQDHEFRIQRLEETLRKDT